MLRINMGESCVRLDAEKAQNGNIAMTKKERRARSLPHASLSQAVRLGAPIDRNMSISGISDARKHGQFIRRPLWRLQ